MPYSQKARSPRLSWRSIVPLALLVALVTAPLARANSAIQAPVTTSDTSRGSMVRPDSVLSTTRPDFRNYINEIRPVSREGERTPWARRIYMALVRPGASDIAGSDSAPLMGPGVRNDIIYDRASIDGGRSDAWLHLLLDHEYFHARHLAGTTSLPVPQGVDSEIERHFLETAAWGFNVAEARDGRYPGLRHDEFREALDNHGEHYRALREITMAKDPQMWDRLSELLRRPVSFTTPN